MTLPWDTLPVQRNPLRASVPCASDLYASTRRSTHPPSNADSSDARIHPVLVIGGGLAGGWICRKLAEQGIEVLLVDKGDIACAASGNPAGIAKPFVTRAPSHAMSFYRDAYARLLANLHKLNTGTTSSTPYRLHESAGQPILNTCGVLQLVHRGYPASADYASLNASQANELGNATLGCPALHFDQGGWLDPRTLCQKLIGHALVQVRTNTEVTHLSQCVDEAGQMMWKLALNDRETYARRIVFACGTAIGQFSQTRALTVTPARGQISRFAVRDPGAMPNCVISGKHYVIPDGDSILVGATFDRGNTDTSERDEDHQRNLKGLAATLPQLQVKPAPLAGYAGVRATTPDRLPLAGPLPDMDKVAADYDGLRSGKTLDHYSDLPCLEGLYVLGGLGSRGIVTAPIIAEMLVDLMMGRASNWTAWAPLINPARFLIRDLKRGKSPQLKGSSTEQDTHHHDHHYFST